MRKAGKNAKFGIYLFQLTIDLVFSLVQTFSGTKQFEGNRHASHGNSDLDERKTHHPTL
jgi:hypothetical protein